MPRLEGWWGHDAASRFNMDPEFIPMPTAEAWQLSNAPVLNMAVHKVALDLFEEAGMDALRERSLRLTAYLEKVVQGVAQRTGTHLEILTPSDPAQRGCQLSIVAHGQGRSLFDHLMAHGVVVDWREPAVIRMAPVPLYNSFEDIARFGKVLEEGPGARPRLRKGFSFVLCTMARSRYAVFGAADTAPKLLVAGPTRGRSLHL